MVSSLATLELVDDIAVLTLNSPPVNALSHALRVAIVEGVRDASANPNCHAIVLICAGKTFIAGADITEFNKPLAAPTLLDVEDVIEQAPKPIIAAIHGTALGGGFETALCCHYRVAVASAKCGLPEVHLGLIPGAGGTQRLPRAVGVEMALEMMTSGKQVDANTLATAGVIDAIVPEGALRDGAIDFARKLIVQSQPQRKIRDWTDKLVEARKQPELFRRFREANARKFRGFLAPEYCIRALEAAVHHSFEEGLRIEQAFFSELLRSPESAAQRYVFFAERQVWKVAEIPDSTPTLSIRKIGIVGAGTMGGGIAMNFANVGLPVTIVERQQAALDRGLEIIRANFEGATKRGKLTADDMTNRMGLLTGSLSLADLADCDLIIEAVFEDLAVKKAVFTQLDAVAKPNAILASNTSALDLNQIAAVTSRPRSVIGLHFFSPANVMRLVEVVRGDETSKEAIATCMQLSRRIGKIAVLVGVCPGFVGNRMLFARQAQAEAMLLEGVTPWQIDQVLYEFGMPMGPFAMMDLAGLDIGWSPEASRGESVRDVLCEMGRRGQKTNAGYYDYDEQRRPQPSPITERVTREFAHRSGRPQRNVSAEEMLERCIYPMINEGAKVLEERVAQRASDIDVVWINGYGWPAYRGGPMYYADQIGARQIVERLNAYRGQLGPNFTLSPLLAKLAASNERFSDLK
jgi:3-hydroxyacyl-CoA dehydrogenase